MSAAAAGMIIALLAAGAPTPRTQTAKQPAPARKHQIEQLIAGLGSDSYATREASTDALAAIGEDAVPFIERGLSNPDLEVQRRSELVLALIRWDVSPELRRVIGNLMVGFEKRNHTEREIIVRALASAEKKHAVRPLARIVTIEKHRGVWLSAVWALFDMGPEGELALAELGVEHNWPERLDIGIRIKLGNSLLEDGQYDKAMEQYSIAIKKAPNNEILLYNMACVCSLKKEFDQALEWLRKAIDAGYDDANWMENDSDLDNLRDHPKYKQMLRELRVKEQLRPRRNRPET